MDWRPGDEIGHYRLLEVLGEGGMGVVWLAQDQVLSRKVAIKILIPEIASDPARRQLFLEEARLASSVGAANVVQVHELGRQDDVDFIVMEYVEGEPLSRRLQGRPLPWEDTVRIALQVARGLAKAHRKQLLHRDVKPANILVTPDAEAKIVDFGLATLVAPANPQTVDMRSLSPMPRVVGTVHYMSPEQARGEVLDARSDIYSLGSVLYEMSTGQRPFLGDHSSDVLGQVARGTPMPAPQVEPTIPVELARIIEKSMAKRRTERYQTMDDVAVDLKRVGRDLESGSSVSWLEHQPPTSRGRAAWIWGLAGAVVLLLGLGWWLRPRSDHWTVTRTVQITRDEGLELDPALSPDGTRVAFASGVEGRRRILVRQVDGEQVVPLSDDRVPGTHGWPRWSPDGTRIAYRTRGAPSSSIQLVEALGGRSVEILTSLNPMVLHGHDWSPHGDRLAFARGDSILIWSLEDRRVERSFAVEDAHSPAWSPDGRTIVCGSGNSAFVFLTHYIGNAAPSSLLRIDLATGRVVTLAQADAFHDSPTFSADGNTLFFISDRAGSVDVFAMPTRAGAGAVPTRLTTGIDAHSISMARRGTRLAYATYSHYANIFALPIAASEALESSATPITVGQRVVEGMDIAHDGRWIAYASDQSGNFEIYVAAIDGSDPRRITRDETGDFLPTFSPDAREIAFHSFRSGSRDIFIIDVQTQAVSRVTDSPGQEYMPDWSPDALQLVYTARGGAEAAGLWRTRRAARGAPWEEPVPLGVDGEAPRWSPDGQRVLYLGADGLWLCSPEGEDLGPVRRNTETVWCSYGVWSPDGRSIFFREEHEDRSVLYQVPAMGGVARMVVELAVDPTFGRRTHFGVDDRRLYFERTEQESNIWVMELSTN